MNVEILLSVKDMGTEESQKSLNPSELTGAHEEDDDDDDFPLQWF